jgi:CoA:oxalate CoA-transferase
MPTRGALAGITVVEFARWQPSAWLGMLLAQLGARVVKIEDASQGEPMRHATGLGSKGDPNHVAYNRGKQSLAINYRLPDGLGIVHDLFAAADVGLHDFRPDYSHRYGLSWPRLSARNPALVLAVMSGFGQGNEYSNLEVYDMEVQARSGIMSLTGTDATGPLLAGITLGECLPALYGALAVAAALVERQSSGLGRHLDISMFDCTVAATGPFLQYLLSEGFAHPPRGRSDPLMPATLAAKCADGKEIYVSAIGDSHFERLCEVLDLPGPLVDERFGSLEDRRRHREELNRLLTDAIGGKHSVELLSGLKTLGVPSALISGLNDVVDDSFVRERGLIGEVQHPVWGSTRVPVFPVVDEDTPRIPHAPTTMGEHSVTVLTELLGVTPEGITKLREDGVLHRAG